MRASAAPRPAASWSRILASGCRTSCSGGAILAEAERRGLGTVLPR